MNYRLVFRVTGLILLIEKRLQLSNAEAQIPYQL